MRFGRALETVLTADQFPARAEDIGYLLYLKSQGWGFPSIAFPSEANASISLTLRNTECAEFSSFLPFSRLHSEVKLSSSYD
jgi:hypothetical protein